MKKEIVKHIANALYNMRVFVSVFIDISCSYQLCEILSRGKNKRYSSLFFFIFLPVKLQELKANPQRNAKGTVIEAGLQKSKGPVATFIVQNGTLKRGDVVVCGQAFGKVGKGNARIINAILKLCISLL